MNKLLTVLINVLIWDKHASPVGIAALCVCLGGGAMYQQAPLRRSKGYAPLGSNDMNEEELVELEKGCSRDADGGSSSAGTLHTPHTCRHVASSTGADETSHCC